ncbi:Gp19/Gp15/Gp42 family protein [Puerhibacterium puerhi]|uniref:Gp19/Gp15/Gp42 family protein n=1 Tax=Puerhibacterium puerhi TaxID=2692623 RepID=UPI0013592E09|nr:Gp19/Gp15/Gp42 family protein [Puerhibacterium puerhi]
MAEIDWLKELRDRAEGDVLAGYSDAYLMTKIGDAVAFIDDMVPAAKRRLQSGQLSQRTYIKTVCDVVLRVLRDPEGYRSESDGTYSYTRSATVASGDMWLTNNDLTVLRGTTTPVVGTIGLSADRGWGR